MSTALEVRLSEEQMDELAAKIAQRLAPAKARRPRTVIEAAEQLNVSEHTIYTRVKAGTIRKVPDIGVIRIPAEEIERLLSESL